MALDPFSGVFTAAQIVTVAERRSNNPGARLTPNGIEPNGTAGNTMLDAPAYAELQTILDELALTENFTFTRTALDIIISARINDLPSVGAGDSSGYWRVGFSDPGWISDPTTNGRSRFRFLDAEQFHEMYQESGAGTPTVGYVNRSNGTLIVDPPPDRLYNLELHFYPWQIALATIDSRPWFPYSEYLIEALSYKLYLSGDDTRRQDAAANMARMMKRIKSSLGDDRDRASAKLELDPAYFRTPYRF